MLRKLKHHESKLLKKVDFLDWKDEGNLHISSLIQRYGLSDRQEYNKYYKVIAQLRKLTGKLSKMDSEDPFRKIMTQALLKKLYDMGLIQRMQSLADADVSVTSILRRRLAIVLRHLNMCQTLDQAQLFVRQGHVRVGPHVMLDPAVLITRKMEDFVTWTDDSKIRQKILKHNDEIDDYDLNN